MSATQQQQQQQTTASHNDMEKFRRECAAFDRMLPELLKTHKGLFVAIHEGKLIASGNDWFEVSRQATQIAGNVSLLVTQVTDQPPRPVRVGARGLVEV